MEARVKFSPFLLKQEGTVGKILRFVQQNPNSAKNTNITLLAKTMSLGGVGKTTTLAQMLQRMVNNQMLTRWGGKRHANFRINYYHKDIPGYILENAPEDERKRVERMREELKPNQHISDEGCVVTPGEKKVEPTIIKPVLPDLKEDKPKEEETLESSSDMSEENTTSVPIKIEDTERGLSISITLNLTINK